MPPRPKLEPPPRAPNPSIAPIISSGSIEFDDQAIFGCDCCWNEFIPCWFSYACISGGGGAAPEEASGGALDDGAAACEDGAVDVDGAVDAAGAEGFRLRSSGRILIRLSMVMSESFRNLRALASASRLPNAVATNPKRIRWRPPSSLFIT